MKKGLVCIIGLLMALTGCSNLKEDIAGAPKEDYTYLAPTPPMGWSIDSVFQPLAVNIVPDRLHAAGEFDPVAHEAELFIPLLGPGFIDDQVDITGVAHAGTDHCIGGGLDFCLVNVVGKKIPTGLTCWTEVGSTLGTLK